MVKVIGMHEVCALCLGRCIITGRAGLMGNGGGYASTWAGVYVFLQTILVLLMQRSDDLDSGH